MTSALCVVQARMGSSRLPGKVLEPLGAHTVLGLILQRLGRSDRVEVVVATSDQPIDEPIVEEARRFDTRVVRGSELDVLARFGAALDGCAADIVVRITADCPLVDPGIVEAALDRQAVTKSDYCSNTLVRTYPDGLDVEVIEATALRQAIAEATDAVEREHVTPFIYRRPERFALSSLICDQALGDERWTLDTPEDLLFLREVVSALEDPVSSSWMEVLAHVGERADRSGLRAVPDTSVRVSDGIRAWTVQRDGLEVARGEIAVTAGRGTLSIEGDAGRDTIEVLERVLSADAQVNELSIEGPQP